MALPGTIAGKYEVLHRIGAGGMAEVFLARQTGLKGFQKLVVIKRILPHLADQAEFVQLFLDEARTAASLRHNNIVDIYDVGEDAGTYFLAMEYLDGRDLGRVQAETAILGQPIPLDFSVHVAIDVARGLHHAHTRADLDGRALGIVHRDVSPQNVIVSYEGIAKVVDFGIAKAASRPNTTEPGMVKGKFHYLAPEQAEGKTVDARADQFSLGVVLWELTTGRRLFKRESEALSFRAIVEGNVPRPSEYVAGFPSMLESIILRALSLDREARFENCEALALELERFLEMEKIAHSALRVGDYLKRVLRESSADLRPARPDALTIVGVRASPGEATLAPRPLESRRATNLAADVDEFVGRTADLDALTQLFAGGARLVSLAGPGGSGKTRLAQKFARARLATLSDAGGAWFCDVTEARGPEGIASALGETLGLPLSGTTAAETIQKLGVALANRGRLLLIVDNFEQVVDHAPATIGRWLEMAPELLVLVTSRERLKLDGEHLHDLEPLSETEAVRLFVQRVRAVKRSFSADADAAAISEIVQKLDGIPLAIELAASRMGILTPPQLLERLSKSLDVLSGSRKSASRQATLRAVMDWSWGLLHPWEQDALAQASVFRGGFSLEAAEEVLDLSAHDGAPWVLDVVASLCDKSLLRRHEAPGTREARFAMYVNVREYAAERLGERTAAAEARHAAWFLRVGAEWAASINGPRERESRRRLHAELENLAAVLTRALAAKDASGAFRALTVLDPILSTRGPFAAHLRWLDEAIALPGPADPLLLADALEQRGRTLRFRGRAPEAIVDLLRAVAMAREAGAHVLQADALTQLAIAHVSAGSVEEALARAREALTLARAAGDKRCEASVRGNLAGILNSAGLWDDAMKEYEEALSLDRSLGFRRYEGVALFNYANVLREHGRLDEARERFERALELSVSAGDRGYEGSTLGGLAIVAFEQGRIDDARELFRRSLAIEREVANQLTEGLMLGNIGIFEHTQSRFDDARASYSGAVSILAEINPLLESLYAGFFAALEADEDHLDAAEARLASARARLTGTNTTASLIRATHDVLEGHLDLARSRKSGDASLVEKARARSADARARKLPEQFEDLRYALALLDRALTR